MRFVLPEFQGQLTPNAPLAPHTTLKIGGPAEALLEPANEADLLAVWQWHHQTKTPVWLLGQGSNVLISDNGLPGLTVLMGGLAAVTVKDSYITAQAGATCGKVARTARAESLAGLEFFAGIPGSIGGALKMNAGAYGSETFDFVAELTIINEHGQQRTLNRADIKKELNPQYRQSNIPPDWLILSATFALQPGDPTAIKAQMRQVNENRRTSQPLHLPSSGSWFKNVVLPDGTTHKAWQLTESIGGRGWQKGDAAVSEQHANFFVNLGQATARDMMLLSNGVATAIQKQHNITMELEVQLLGEHTV